MSKQEQIEVFFIKLPEKHELAIEIKNHSASFDSEIPLPFIPSLTLDSEEGLVNTASEQSSYNTTKTEKKAEINREMIFAGLLYIFAYDRENIHFEYYKTIFLELKKNSKKELLAVAQFQIKNFEFDSAFNLLLALEGLFPDNPQIILNIALFYDERAKFYRRSELIAEANDNEFLAESYYKAAMDIEPVLPDAFYNAAFFFIGQRKYAQARNLLHTFISIEERDDSESRQKKEKARKAIENINSQKLDDLAYADAIAFINNDENEKALSRIRDFLSEHTKSWNGWFVLAWALRKLERYEDAKKAFLHALEIANETQASDIEEAYPDLCNEIAICYLNLKDFDKAKKWLNSALDFDCENIKIISNLGMLYYTEGDLKTAESFFRTVTVFSPEDKTALYMLDTIKNEGNS